MDLLISTPATPGSVALTAFTGLAVVAGTAIFMGSRYTDVSQEFLSPSRFTFDAQRRCRIRCLRDALGYSSLIKYFRSAISHISPLLIFPSCTPPISAYATYAAYLQDSNQDETKIANKHYEAYLQKLQGTATGKIIVITGANQGLGMIFAVAAAHLGAKKVILLNRRGSGDYAESEIKSAGAKVVRISCDLSSFANTRAAAAAVLKDPDVKAFGIDVLCLNAGIMAVAEAATMDGYEVQMQVNHLSHFLLAKLLMEPLEKAAERTGEARIVTQTSGARGPPFVSGLAARNLEKYDGKLGSLGGNQRSMVPPSGEWKRYGQTKLANYMFCAAFSQRFPDSKVKAMSGNPGVSISNLQRNAHKEGNGMRNFDLWMARKMSHSNMDATLPSIVAAFSPDAKSGDIYNPRGGEWGPPSEGRKKEKVAWDPVQQELLWTKSEAAVGEKFL
jgi:NAD(P)-dependent dehydrogenase (short-subunit alcohol dehydrogenase family)